MPSLECSQAPQKDIFPASRPHYQTPVKTKECDIRPPPPSAARLPAPSPAAPTWLRRRLPPPASPPPRRAGRPGTAGRHGAPLPWPPGSRRPLSLWPPHSLVQAPLPRVRVPGYGSKWLLEGAGPARSSGCPPHPPPLPAALRGRRPPSPSASPAPGPPSPGFRRQSRQGSGGRGVCDGAGVGNGSPALGGAAEAGVAARPRAGLQGARLASHTPPRRPCYLPVHCRTGQSFAHRNRATQPARHTSGEKMAARARRKLPKVPERTGQRAAERAERAGARLREARGGREDEGEWAPPPPPPPPRRRAPGALRLPGQPCTRGARRPGSFRGVP